MPLRMMRYLDLALLALALPIFLAAGLPLLGWAGAAVGWLIQRGVQLLIENRARASDDPRTVAGLLTGSMIARGWIVAGSIFVVGLSDREAGLSAAILSITLFTFYFTGQMIGRPFEEEQLVSRRSGKVLLGVASVWLASCARSLLYAIFGSDGKNEEFKPQNEFKLDPWIELKIGAHRHVASTRRCSTSCSPARSPRAR